MTPRPVLLPALCSAALFLVYGALLRLLRQVKYKAAPAQRALTAGDWGSAALGGILVGGLGSLHPLGAVPAALLGTLSLWLLWLDAALYRLFSFELGLGGVGGVVLSNLYQEVAKMDTARRFFRSHRAFALAPAAILGAHLVLLLPAGSGAQLTLSGALAAYLVWAHAPTPEPTSAVRPARLRRALLHDFLRPRRPRVPARFQPRPEHAFLLAQQPALPSPSAHHGVLAGRSVVLLTFESLSAAHLADPPPDKTQGRAQAQVQNRAWTPFLDSLRAAAVASAHHCCLAPLTNCAHLALYSSQAAAPPGPWHLQPLHRAGYRSLYLTAATVEHYGLAGILRRAGFQHVLDARVLAPHPGDGGCISDRALLVDGLRRLRQLLGAPGGPFFLHVHAANTHIPYRVADRSRFCYHDLQSDRGRFLSGIEESDWLFGELFAALRSLCAEQAAGEPLLVVSSDHGQSFGEGGYFSHGSAVRHEQLSVPLLLSHPRLAAPAPRFSTHFDVLPTILDLLGLAAEQPGFGTSIFNTERQIGHLLWDGQPTRPTSTCLGLQLAQRKIALDLARGTCIESDWHDGDARLLSDGEHDYFEALLGALARHRGVQ
ncbi:MAG: sulfatase-like hydrolase/transferase [Polyangia bacterium]